MISNENDSNGRKWSKQPQCTFNVSQFNFPSKSAISLSFFFFNSKPYNKLKKAPKTKKNNYGSTRTTSIGSQIPVSFLASSCRGLQLIAKMKSYQYILWHGVTRYCIFPIIVLLIAKSIARQGTNRVTSVSHLYDPIAYTLCISITSIMPNNNTYCKTLY